MAEAPWHRARAAWLVATLLVVCVPLVAMQVTDEVDWSVGDFAAAAVLVGGAGLVHDLAARRVRAPARRAAVGAVLAAAVLVVWAGLAVGLTP